MLPTSYAPDNFGSTKKPMIIPRQRMITKKGMIIPRQRMITKKGMIIPRQG